MPLELQYTDQAKIPEGQRDFYIESDGVFKLDVPGIKTQSDFDNYADALKKRFADASADFSKHNNAGLNRDDVVGIIDGALQKFTSNQSGGSGDKGDGKGEGQGSGDVSARLHDLERNLASVTGELDKAKQERDDAINQRESTTIRNQLTQAVAKSGVIPDGVGNLVTLVESNFEMAQDGSAVTKLDAGNGVSPNQNPADFLTALARQKEYRMYWPPSEGTGADGSGGGGGGGGDTGKGNPWTKAGWNITNQSKLYSSNKADAERLMQAAGVKLGAVSPVR